MTFDLNVKLNFIGNKDYVQVVMRAFFAAIALMPLFAEHFEWIWSGGGRGGGAKGAEVLGTVVNIGILRADRCHCHSKPTINEQLCE